MAHHANADYVQRSPDSNFTMMQAFEWYCEGGGVHWDKLSEKSTELANWGITALWIPPPTKAAGQDSVGYDIYDHWDLGEFDQKGGRRTKYGTREQLDNLIKVTRDKGIAIYLDAVFNHKFGADAVERFKAKEVDSDNRTQEISDAYDVEGWTKFEFPGRGEKYSSLKWNFNHFTGVDYNADGGKTAIFKIQGDGKDWARNVDHENGNYDFLMGADIDHHHPDVYSDFLAFGKWAVDEVGVTGFRFDAIKHIDEKFIGKFISETRNTTKKPKLFAVGEFWKNDLGELDEYLSTLGTQFSLFDTPLHYNFKQAGDQGADFNLTQIFDNTIVQKRPIDAVTLVDNHDTQVGQSLESWVNPMFKPIAYSLILLRPDGYPCVFWGDLYGCAGDNPQEPVSQLSDLILARKLFAYGDLRDYFDHPNCVGWVRMGDSEHDGLAVVACNGDEGLKRMEVGKEHTGEKWIDLLGWHQGDVIIGEDGWADFRCSARSVSVWIKEDARGRDELKK
ncbi:putative alpha-amylase [Clavulina sp. PMI_390]|nr:putative alpha-amylase [Clavulina sp. PMI_390]